MLVSLRMEAQSKFEKIYEEYADAIFRHLFYRLGNRERALDLTQEVFSRLWQYLKDGKEVSMPKAFLYKSAHNAFINEIRKPATALSLDLLSEKGFEVEYEGEDTDTLALQNEMVEKISSLDYRAKEVLTMRFIDGLQVKEMAELLGEKENTISVRIKRALEKLQNIYGI